MRSSWTGPSDSFASAKPQHQKGHLAQSALRPSRSGAPSKAPLETSGTGEEVYRALVVDSGPIIKHTGTNTLYGKAQSYYTVPAVLDEIRDAKARSHLDQWPMELLVKEPTPEAMARVVAFSKLTGDYASLSKVDLQVLALVVDLEQEGCRSLQHLRVTPKRKIGLGLQSTAKGTEKAKAAGAAPKTSHLEEEKEAVGPVDHEIEIEFVYDQSDDDQSEEEEERVATEATPAPSPIAPVSWAQLVDASQGSAAVEVPPPPQGAPTGPSTEASNEDEDEDEDEDEASSTSATATKDHQALEKELASDFPSLSAAATVPYEGSDDENDHGGEHETSSPLILGEGSSPATIEEGLNALTTTKEEEEEEERRRRKEEALKPISKSGKLYNSFRKYGKLMKPKPTTKPKVTTTKNLVSDDENDQPQVLDRPWHDPTQSRMLGSAAGVGAEEMKAEDDDGEGWITSTKDIARLKNRGGKGSHGGLDPLQKLGPEDEASEHPKAFVGPAVSQRTACTTTDFAMQNVLLQMGLLLLSVDGMRIRKMKSWVLRCGACFKIHTEPVDPRTGMRRMFCSHCGSDMMQRVSASVDGKTGRLKLHLSKKYKHNLRGTKFSLPKAGNGNRFQGDLLLREDQLMMGAWNQKVKKNSGGKSRAHAQSIFGQDIATNVGCKASAALPSDIRVGFGRRNPNSAKGRERRGKKKKSSDRACGLRRY